MFGEIRHLVTFRVNWRQHVKIHFEFDGVLVMYIEALQW
jgi:hypothetical protein